MSNRNPLVNDSIKIFKSPSHLLTKSISKSNLKLPPIQNVVKSSAKSQNKSLEVSEIEKLEPAILDVVPISITFKNNVPKKTKIVNNGQGPTIIRVENNKISIERQATLEFLKKARKLISKSHILS